jgi:hypothetical protein
MTMVAADGGSSATCLQPGAEIRRYSWAELGVPVESVQASRGALHVLFAADGADFREQALPPTPDGWTVSHTRTVASATEYVVLVELFRPTADGNGEGRTIAYRSTDGTTWTTSDVPAGLGSGAAGVLADGSIAIAGHGDRGQGATAVLRDGVWQSTDLSSLDLGDEVLTAMSLQTAVGPAGFAAIAFVGRPVEAPIVHATVPTSTMPGGTAPPTTVIGMTALDGTGRGVDQDSLRPVLLFSPDGVTWSSTNLAELAGGSEGYFTNVTVDDRSVVVRHVPMATGSSDPNAPLPDQTMFVGTPA